MIKMLYFCWVFIGAAAPPSPSPQPPANCTLGEWLPAHTIVMPGTYTDEDTRMNRKTGGRQ